MQNTTKERIRALLAKNIALTCIMRVYGVTLKEILLASKNEDKKVKLSLKK